MKKINDLENLAKKYRRELFEKLLIIKQGHLGSIYSMMETVVTLYHCGFVKFDEKRKKFLDKVLISKGHATAALYPILRDFGLVKEKEWNDWGHKSSLLRVFGNISIPGIDVTSGSLGHCIGVGAGMAISYKRTQQNKKVFVIISEGELYEGSTWEALLFAKHNKLDNLTVIIDINSLIILGKTRTNKVIFSVTALLIIGLIYYLYTYMFQNQVAVLYVLFLILGPLLYVLIKIWNADTKHDYRKLSGILKLVMLFGVISMAFYQFML